MANETKSVLLTTSASSDVQYVGGSTSIQGLEAVKNSRIVDFSQINYKAEVPQVVTIGATAYTPTANTAYTIMIGDRSRTDHGYTESLKKYTFTTPDDITTLGATAALQREAITAGILAKVNAIASNYVIGATLTLGNGFTITDDAGYFPYNRQGMNNRRGGSTVLPVTNSDGTGFADTNFVLTTAAVYESGTGLNLLNNAPVYDFMTGNLISGEFDSPKTISGGLPVSGQKYNMFSISYLSESPIPTMSGVYKCFVLKTNQVWVDNGAGSSVTNLAGYIAFERAMHRGISSVYSSDPSSIAEFFDSNFIIQGPLGAVPVATADLKNKFLTGYGNLFNHTNINAQIIVAPSQGATGLLIDQDATATDGAHYSAEVATSCPKEFIVGKTAVTYLFKASATTVANIVLLAGLRKKEAYTASFDNYTEMVAAGTGPAGTTFYTYGILANAATMATTTSVASVNSTEFTIRIQVDLNGLCAVYINDVKYPVYSAGTTPLLFAAGTVLIPFFQYTNLNSAAAVGNVTELLALPKIGVIN